jgi:hypothetical protein
VYLGVPVTPGGGPLELAGDPDEQVFPPVRRDQLHADGQAARRPVQRQAEEFRLEHHRGRGFLQVVAECLQQQRRAGHCGPALRVVKVPVRARPVERPDPQLPRIGADLLGQRPRQRRRVVARQAIEAAGVPWPQDIPVPPFRPYSAPGAFAALLADVGFTGTEARLLNWEHRVDPQEWWQVYRAQVGTNGAVIARQDDATIERIKGEFDSLAARYATGDGVVALPASAVLASGTRRGPI